MTVLTEQEKRDEQLLQQLREEVAAVTPDPWDKILARVQAETQPKPETETVVPLPQRSRSGGAWRRWVAAAAGISERDLAAWDVQLDESGAQPVYRVTLTTVYYFHPRYVVTVDQMTGAVVSMENVRQ